jgi:transglutaminase-like putative cysteine protease
MTDTSNSWIKAFLFRDWPHRLTVLLSGLFLLQLVSWISKEDGIWLPETVVIVQLVLLTTFVLEHIPILHWLVRGALQLISVIWINVLVLERFKVIETMELSSFLSSRLFLNLYELTPYLWFGLGAWVVYLTVIWWVEVKWRVYALMLISVLALCIRDSFSNIYLWTEVAIVIGCGLFLLILCHFNQLRRKDPAAWGYLAEYPASIAIPVIGFISLTVALGALMPEVNPVLTDPYTAWRQFRGEPMNFTTGKGISVSATGAAGDSSSGYSRNDSSLGSGFQFDYTPVMTVDTTHRAYWRGEERSLYSGKGWEESDLEKRAASIGVRADNLLPADSRVPAGKLKTVEVTQTVTMLNEEKYPVVFGAYSIQKVTDINGAKTGFEPLQWTASQSELRFNERQPFPKSYTVVSQVPVVDEELLRKATDVPNRTDFAEYLQLPDSLPARVRQLAADITKTASTPYDKAKQIEQYLQSSFPYNNKPDVTKGRSRDFVDRFLFEIKEGYCDYFSSAMAVMARSVGLPTRWVKGYASGATSMDEEILGYLPLGVVDPNAGGVYTVRNSDAHSWVEVYINGYGWIPFEPTAGFALPRVAPEAELLPETPLEESEVPASAPAEADPAVEPQHVATGGILAAVAAVAVFLGWKFQVLELIRERNRRRRASQLKQKIIVECERLLRIFKRNGYSREDHETLREAVRRWTKQSKWMKSDLETVLAIFEKAKYGKVDVSEEDWRHTSELVEKLRSQM